MSRRDVAPELAASHLRLLLTWQADNIERSYRIPSYSLHKADIIYIFLFIMYIFTRNFYLTVINFPRLLAFHSMACNSCQNEKNYVAYIYLFIIYYFILFLAHVGKG